MIPSPTSLSTWPPNSVTIAGEGGEHPVGDHADALGVEVLGPAGEVRQVAEQHGDDPALGLDLGSRDRQRRHRSGSRTARPATAGVPQTGQVMARDR